MNINDDLAAKIRSGNVVGKMVARKGNGPSLQSKEPLWTTREFAEKFGISVYSVGKVLSENMEPAMSCRSKNGSSNTTRTYWQYSIASKILQEFISKNDKP